MLNAARGRDTLVRQILKWASTEAAPSLAPESALGTTDRERELLAALGGLASVISKRAGPYPIDRAGRSERLVECGPVST